ncbi:hypothetical protein [Bacillus sp. REN3]|nr:hypothetical protein [Bacillus sp. REN3]
MADSEIPGIIWENIEVERENRPFDWEIMKVARTDSSIIRKSTRINRPYK